MTSLALRATEIQALDSFLARAEEQPQALVLEGEAGIGKSALVETALDLARARGFRVAVAHIGHPETSSSYAALGDLFDGVDDELLATLPAPQRAALDVALLRVPPSSEVHDARAIGLGTLAVVRAVATRSPLLVVMDDLQWLDASSSRAIGFALQRLVDEPVGVLVTRRLGTTATLDLDHLLGPQRVERLLVGPLPAQAFGQIFRDRLRVTLPRSVTTQIHALAEGNPFYGIEVARELLRRGMPGPGEPLPLPGDALQVVSGRVAALPVPTARVLAATALLARPTPELLASALPEVDVPSALVDAERDGLVGLQAGRIAFTHRLLASAVLATTSTPDRRELHARLAAILDDPEEQARHLALARTGPDADVAEALDRACLSARRRGAAAAAAELALLARERTPVGDVTGRMRRDIVAAQLTFESGDANRAHEVLERALAETPVGGSRAALRNLLCEFSWQDTTRVEQLARESLLESGMDAAVAAAAHASLAWVGVYRGDQEWARTHADSAMSLTADDPRPGVRAPVLTVAAIAAFLDGRPHQDLLDEAVRLEAQDDLLEPSDLVTFYSSGHVVRGLLHLWEGDLEAARRHLEVELSLYESQGRYVARDEILCYLAMLGCRSGDWDRALAHAEECLEIGSESGHLRGRGQNVVPRAWLAALAGDLETARRFATEGLELSLAHQDLLAVANNRGVLGFAALSTGDVETAARHLRPVVHHLRRSGTAQPGQVPFVGDAVEALTLVGALDEAQDIVDDDRLMGRTSARPELHVAQRRGAALLAAALGDVDGAVRVLEDLLASPVTAQQPLERARVLLALGDAERRRKQRSIARDHLTAARDSFRRLGAQQWLARAEESLARVAGTPNGLDLTPTERRLAGLVAEGCTNVEAAERMYLSVKTVEANLSRIYRKLGVRSRSELVRLVLSGADDPSAGTAEPGR